jgi:predicted RNA binding protein YcfA (HicA-like mRNA interferase family)
VPRLKRVSASRTIRALERLGFQQVRQRGSHVVLRKDTEGGAAGCVVPLHRELAVGTLRGILRQAGVSVDEFLDNL